MNGTILEFRHQICQNLLAAGVTDENAIIAKAKTLENYVFSQDENTAKPVTKSKPAAPVVEAEPVTEPEPTIEAEPKLDTAQEQTPDLIPEPEPEVSFAPVDRSAILAAAKQLAASQGKEAVFEVLGKFGVNTVTKLAENDLAAALAEFEKAVAVSAA